MSVPILLLDSAPLLNEEVVVGLDCVTGALWTFLVIMSVVGVIVVILGFVPDFVECEDDIQDAAAC